MAFSLKLKASPKEEITAKVGRAAGILGLQELLQRYPKESLGGQRQCVAMGRAIVRDPSVFLFDEPVFALGGEKSYGATMATDLSVVANDVKGGIVPNSGPWVMEENPT